MKTLLKTAAIAAGAAALLLTAGCTATPGAGATTDTASQSPAAAAATAPPADVGKGPESQLPAATEDDMYGSKLYAPRRVKAGSTLKVTGGTLDPGTKVAVFAARNAAEHTRSATEDMQAYLDRMMITEMFTAVADAEGRYSVDLPIPAGTEPQQIEVALKLPGGVTMGVMSTIE
jgi:hypothetical protein